MVRTQVYLTEQQRDELARVAKTVGKKQSELIREAIDQFLDHASSHRREVVLREVAGLWENRMDLPDLKTIRAEWNRD